MRVEPYLNFNGRCEEAIEFYKRALGAEVLMLLRFGENPDSVASGMVPPGGEQKILHATWRIGNSLVMGSDSECNGKPSFAGISLSLTTADAAEAQRCFAALAEGGQVQMPLTKTFFSEAFGMVADRFGVSWMVVSEKH